MIGVSHDYGMMTPQYNAYHCIVVSSFHNHNVFSLYLILVYKLVEETYIEGTSTRSIGSY